MRDLSPVPQLSGKTVRLGVLRNSTAGQNSTSRSAGPSVEAQKDYMPTTFPPRLVRTELCPMTRTPGLRAVLFKAACEPGFSISVYVDNFVLPSPVWY